MKRHIRVGAGAAAVIVGLSAVGVGYNYQQSEKAAKVVRLAIALTEAKSEVTKACDGIDMYVKFNAADKNHIGVISYATTGEFGCTLKFVQTLNEASDVKSDFEAPKLLPATEGITSKLPAESRAVVSFRGGNIRIKSYGIFDEISQSFAIGFGLPYQYKPIERKISVSLKEPSRDKFKPTSYSKPQPQETRFG